MPAAGSANGRRLAAAALGVFLGTYLIRGLVKQQQASRRVQVLFRGDDKRMSRILSSMPRRLQEGFAPTFFAHESYGQLGLLMLWKFVRKLQAARLSDSGFKRTVIQCEDGGQVALEEYYEADESLNANSPVLLILHTITGEAHDELELSQSAYKRGFRPIILSRRGHFGPLKTVPKFNLMGCTNDTRHQIEFVRSKYPHASFIGAIGISAGSGQVVSFIGQRNEDRLVDCAVSLCPAYDISQAFETFRRRSPILEQYLLRGLKRFFLLKNYELFADESSAVIKGFEETLASPSIQLFMENAVHMAGFDSFESYLERSNPMTHYHKNTVPCLVMNALDDPLCVKDNIPLELVGSAENYALVLTDSGSHIAYREGLFGQQCWMHSVALDFVQAAMQDAI